MNLSQLSSIEYDAMFHSDSCNTLTVQDEPFDLASEIEPSVWDKFMPNDGTSRVEHRLRRQGLRKYDDSQRETTQELVIEMMAERRTVRAHIIRQNGGEVWVNQSELGTDDRMRTARIQAQIEFDVSINQD